VQRLLVHHQQQKKLAGQMPVECLLCSVCPAAVCGLLLLLLMLPVLLLQWLLLLPHVC
jgi:hypothetical protein